MEEKFNILRVKDKLDTYTINKHKLFNLPCKLIINAKSGLGKSNLLVNFLVRDIYYAKDFKPENIYIVSVSLDTDDKLKSIVNILNIPQENLFKHYNDEELEILYDYLEKLYNEGDKDHKLIILDDCAFSGDLRAMTHKNTLNKMFMNGRHINLSTWLTTQAYTLVGKNLRLNANGIILFGRIPQKELILISDEHNYLKTKSEFIDKYKDATKNKNDFFVINYTNDNDKIYQDSNFNFSKS